MSAPSPTGHAALMRRAQILGESNSAVVKALIKGLMSAPIPTVAALCLRSIGCNQAGSVP
eukprot:1190065-Prorocentrum_minimum.AAC.2